MTREEALFKAKDVLDEATAYEDAVCYVTDDDREWLELAIKALEQEPKTGYWMDISPSHWACSKCRYVVRRFNNTLYCPNCGCRMEGEIE